MEGEKRGIPGTNRNSFSTDHTLFDKSLFPSSPLLSPHPFYLRDVLFWCLLMLTLSSVSRGTADLLPLLL